MKTLRAAVIGLGVGAEHAQGYTDLPGVELALLCDADPARLERVGSRFPAARCTTDWREVAADGSIDVVSVCTPDRYHYEHAAALVRAGKHILCEKPMCLTVEQARDLVELVYEHGVSFAVGNNCRYMPQFALALEYARSGKLGDLFAVEADYIHDMRDVFVRTPWRMDPQHPQNAIFGGGVHPIDLLRGAAGDAVEVFAYGNNKTLPDYHSQDSILISIKFANGCIGKVWVSFGIRQQPHNQINLNLYGSQGSIRTDSQRPEARLYLEGMALGQNNWATIPLTATLGHPIREELSNLLEAIRYGRNTRVDVVSGARTVALMAAAQESLERGQPVTVAEIATPAQLQMIAEDLEHVPEVTVAPGYGLRTFQPGDEAHWLRICKPEFGMTWDAAGLHREILDKPWFKPEHMFFVTHEGTPVGVATAWRRTVGETVEASVHYIAVEPAHRGQGLGRTLLLAVMHRVRELGFPNCGLRTNDFRWDAIGLYWKYGWRPLIETDLDRRRWRAITRRLGVTDWEG
ncbi:MAG: GNAT family N-acetyltransferase [Chloroflexi bacterium]|nr:GNAT family N-acetyltransferase [Chloroflexota bacterium]